MPKISLFFIFSLALSFLVPYLIQRWWSSRLQRFHPLFDTNPDPKGSTLRGTIHGHPASIGFLSGGSFGQKKFEVRIKLESSGRWRICPKATLNIHVDLIPVISSEDPDWDSRYAIHGTDPAAFKTLAGKAASRSAMDHLMTLPDVEFLEMKAGELVYIQAGKKFSNTTPEEASAIIKSLLALLPIIQTGFSMPVAGSQSLQRAGQGPLSKLALWIDRSGPKAKNIVTYIFPLFVLAFVALIWSQFGKEQEKARQIVETKFQSLRVERIDHVRVWPWQGPDEVPLDLPKEWWPALIEHFQGLSPVEYPSGGCSWTTYRAVDIEFNRVERYRVYIQTCEDNDNRIFATLRDLQIVEDYYFDGRIFWNWLITIPEIRDQPGCPQLPFK